jgi:hypothetical protein
MASFDSTSHSASTTSGTSFNWAHTLGGGSNLVLLVAVDWLTITAITISTITYGAQSLTRIASSLATDGSAGFTELWGLIAPSGNQTITVTMSGTILEALGGAVVAQNADQITGFNTPGINNGTGTNASVVCNSASNEFVVATIVNDAAAPTDTITTTSGTQRWNQAVGNDAVAGSTTPGASPTASSTWTLTQAGDAWCASAVSIKDFVSAVTTTLMGQVCL